MRLFRKEVVMLSICTIILLCAACSITDIQEPENLHESNIEVTDVPEQDVKDEMVIEAQETISEILTDESELKDDVEQEGADMNVNNKKVSAVYEKPRVINITDLLADPDDEQSLL